MPVRNLAPYVGASIQSILDQSYRNFEFLILDDGSSDGTGDIVRKWAAKDARIRVFERERRLGPAGSSNFIVRQARFPLIARMDGDDVSHPERLGLQVEALANNPDACLVGSLWEGIDERGRLVRPRDRWALSRPSPFAPFPHGSIMFRRAAFEAAGGYRADADFWEDLDLYRRMHLLGELLVLPQALYRHRASPLSTRLTSSREAVENSVDRMYRHSLGLAPADAATASRKLLPEVFVSLGSTLVWAGRRPGMLRRLLRRGEMRPDARTAAVLVWTLWATLSPRTLRFCLAWAIAGRDRWAARRFRDKSVFSWTPGIADSAGSDEPERQSARAITSQPIN